MKGIEMSLSIYVIYEKPKDFPDKFVVRQWENDKPTMQHWFADSLKEARKMVPPGKVRIVRDPGDDSVIVESWI